MRAFITELKYLFTLETHDRDGLLLFAESKRRLVIPLYQREYIWPDEKINALIRDIGCRDKFIGNLILDEKDSCYEIVDGQQRITTCFLALASIYNYYVGQPLTQQSIKKLMLVNEAYCLKNESIGDYLSDRDNKIELSITETQDIYSQKETFERAFDTIQKYINSFSSQDEVRDFKEKLLNSKVLVLINDNDPTIRSIEQVFLDINEKAALLEPEDIFKGYCFKNTDTEFHESLRDKWVRIRKCGSGFSKLGFSDLSEYLYVFLLVTQSKEISQKLYLNGKHILEGKSTDETFAQVDEMINWGESVLSFIEKLTNTTYRFEDICPLGQSHANTDDHISLKNMCTLQLVPKGPQYQKIPLMCVIYALRHFVGVRDAMTYDKFRRIITNLYIYSVLFVLSGERKSKGIIDTTMWNALNQDPVDISGVYEASKALRLNKVSEYTMSETMHSFESLSGLYSIIDSYKSNDGWVARVYTKELKYNLEHFIAPDNRNSIIEWCDGEETIKIELDKNTVKKLKKLTINYLIVNEDLNGSMKSFDVITKIEMIRAWFSGRSEIPAHVAVFLDHIENMETYKRLLAMKGTAPTIEQVIESYSYFVDEYMSDESQRRLVESLTTAFRDAFRNN